MEHIVLALAVAALAANLLVHLDRQVIVADVDEYWLHGTTRYYQLMIFALSENSATQELLHRKHPELRVLWHAGLVEIVAHVIVADVDEYWLHDHTRYLQPLRTEAVKWILPPRIIRERSAAMGLDYFISPRVGFYFVLPDLNWTDLDASGGHCAARLRGSWEPLMARRQLLITFASKGYRLACCTMDPGGPLSQRNSWLLLRASARSHTPAFNFKSCSPLG